MVIVGKSFNSDISEKNCKSLQNKELTKMAARPIIKSSSKGNEVKPHSFLKCLMKKFLRRTWMSGEDKAMAFFGTNADSLKAFDYLKLYINDICPDARISVQGSLLVFRTAAGFAYVSLPSNDDKSILFNLAITNRKKLSSSRIEKTVSPLPGSHSYVYHIVIRSINDIDPEVKCWIRQSYEYSKLNYA